MKGQFKIVMPHPECATEQPTNQKAVFKVPTANGQKILLLSGGYYCECDSGFELDRRNENKCVDVNECRKGLCANGICRNKAGSFEFSRIFEPIRSFLTQKPIIDIIIDNHEINSKTKLSKSKLVKFVRVG